MIFDRKSETSRKLAAAKIISESAVNIAEFIVHLEKGSSSEFAAVASALTAEAAEGGSICLDESVFRRFAGEAGETEIVLPKWKDLLAGLEKSSCCMSDPYADEKRPLVIMDGKVYFYKYWLCESSLAEKLKKICAKHGKYECRAEETSRFFDKLYDACLAEPKDVPPELRFSVSQEQLSAAKNALRHGFSVITGGPGTGKTTTVATILAGILTCCPEERIILTAFTGKAASRMTESLKNTLERIRKMKSSPVSADVIDRISSLEGETVHRVLDYRFGNFSFGRGNPLPADIVIVDEASMIDISLFSSLVDALDENTVMILLGDKDQLSSIGAGSVLADICDAASEGLLPRDIVSKLETSQRFDPNRGIGRLAKAVNEQRSADEIIRICDEEDGLKFVDELKPDETDSSKDLFGYIKDNVTKEYSFLFSGRSGLKKLENLNDFKILCPVKEDLYGVQKINEKIEEYSEKSGLGQYDGKPIMITRNDYTNGLFNGDCGIVCGGNALFDNDRMFSLSLLRAYETVYAMTVHKSQGSEYDHVMIIMPERESPVLTKELLYTAITRAKTKVTLVSSRTILESTLAASCSRVSGFKEALRRIGESEQ